MADAITIDPTAVKENLFERRRRGEISLAQLTEEVYEIDQRSRRVRIAVRFLIGLFLPLLFVSPTRE